MIPLCLAEKGEPQIIKKIGGSPEVRQHLENLGFNVGGDVLIVNTLGENIIVKVKEARVALSDGLARKIMV
ncbi:MAG: ferrous iron transport protein A [Lachnospiraceae bacterium]|nr:ferrous iron transport protein A [Lachnospiraceae bacterium]